MDTEPIGESLADQAFGGLSSLMYSERDLADSFVVGGTHCRNGTMSTRSESEDDRAMKFAMHLKRI